MFSVHVFNKFAKYEIRGRKLDDPKSSKSIWRNGELCCTVQGSMVDIERDCKMDSFCILTNEYHTSVLFMNMVSC